MASRRGHDGRRRVRDAGDAGGVELGSSGTGDGGRRPEVVQGTREGRRRRGGPTAQGVSPGREDGADAATVGEVGGARSEAARPWRSRAGKGGGGPAAAAQRGLRSSNGAAGLPLAVWRWGGDGCGGRQLLLPVTASSSG
ncbi:hypothetical protein OsI_01979 [Oryza sativa Indica Group]|uniref:Uncharacterized protein n=1 Tax=Oryza sativa subsp. indica TaxID=39946 RepID=A2WQ47_ORYSI|nr:hypothetical protein OsI_01979 [Oryza sativa Indica Group]